MKNKDACIIVGIARTAAENGRVSTNLHVKSSFDDFHNNPEAGRTCEGEKVESIYVGNYDCSELNVGDEIEILYVWDILSGVLSWQKALREET